MEKLENKIIDMRELFSSTKNNNDEMEIEGPDPFLNHKKITI